MTSSDLHEDSFILISFFFLVGRNYGFFVLGLCWMYFSSSTPFFKLCPITLYVPLLASGSFGKFPRSTGLDSGGGRKGDTKYKLVWKTETWLAPNGVHNLKNDLCSHNMASGMSP